MLLESESTARPSITHASGVSVPTPVLFPGFQNYSVCEKAVCIVLKPMEDAINSVYALCWCTLVGENLEV